MVVALAFGMRLWELGERTMHYDEAIHVHFSWQLANSAGAALGWPWAFGTDYIHSPWMHGPFQIELTAFIFRVFGDSEVTARLAYVVFGAGLVGLPYFLRHHLGRTGALLAAVMLTLSPSLLYFSRFGRNDIIMAFLATALLVLVWRYLQDGRRGYLYLSSALLALMFATKETAYLVVGVFGLLLFVLALPEIVPWALGRVKLAREATPTAFFLLLVTLTLPQWVAIVGLAQGALGLTLANPDILTGMNVPNVDGSAGVAGAPAWAGTSLLLPVAFVPWGVHVAVGAVGLGVLAWLYRRGLGRRDTVLTLLAQASAVAVVALLLFRPISRYVFQGGASIADNGADNGAEMAADIARSAAGGGVPAADLAVAGCLVAAAVGVLVFLRCPWARGSALLLTPVLVAIVYSVLFTPLVNIQTVVDAVLPGGVRVETVNNSLPTNYVVALALLVGSFIVSVVLGVRWLGGAWLVCAGIFYLVWTALFTTLFTNLAGIFTGSWQGMGYWIAQQDVARGDQPWYYYFVGLSVYELLPVVFGLAAAVYFVRKGDVLGILLAFWAAVTLLAYTVASEKMPWLLVNMTLPLILLSAKFLGELSERVHWAQVIRRGTALLLLAAPVAALCVVFLLFDFVEKGDGIGLPGESWGILGAAILLLVAAALLVRTGPRGRSAPLVGLGLAALLLGFGAWGAVRAAYTYDDSNKEFLVYAQGAADLKGTYQTLAEDVFPGNPLPEGVTEQVRVDYDLWYPFVWYVRHDDREGRLNFSCFKEEDDDGWNSSCQSVEALSEAAATDPTQGPSVYVVDASHKAEGDDMPQEYRVSGPHRNLIWFPETYRRPGENRSDEKMGHEIREDFRFFGEVLGNRDSWRAALDYVVFRDLEDTWFNSKYYVYRR